MKKKNVTRVMCLIMMMTLLLSGTHFPVAKAADTDTSETVPVIGDYENLVPDSLTGKLTFGVQYSSTNDTRSWSTTELSDVSGDNWWISQKLNFENRNGNEVWETAIAVTGTIGNADNGRTLCIAHIPSTNYWEIRVKKEPINTFGSVKSGRAGSKTTLELNKDYVLTAQVKNGNTLSFWIDGEKVLSDLSIDELYGESVEWRPAFGWRAYGNLPGTVSDIQVWDGVTLKCPTIGNCENLVPSNLSDSLTFSSSANCNTKELSQVNGNTWYIEQTLNFTERTGNDFFEIAVGVSGTIDLDTEKTVRVGLLPDGSEWSIGSGSGPIYNQWTRLKNGTLDNNLSLKEDHVVTVQVTDGELLSFWIDKKPVLCGYSLTDAGFENMRPAFGYRVYSLAGTCSDIKVWDGVTLKCPTIGRCENLVPESLAGTLEFPTNTWTQLTEFDRVSGNTYYVSATINFPTATTKEYHDMAVAMTSDKGTTIRIGILPGTAWYRVSYQKGNMAEYCSLANIVSGTQSGITIESGKDYTLTVMIKDGDLLSFWINGKRLVNGVSLKTALENAEYTTPELLPAFGYRGYNAYGSYSNIQVWDGVTMKPDEYTEAYSNISSLRETETGEYTAPEPKEGYEDYVFAGWYTDEKCTIPVGSDVIEGEAYAKFVTEDVLTVKAQLKYGTTADSDSTDYRFVTTVDSLDYEKIGFIITIGTETTHTNGTTVYKKITARDNEGMVNYSDPTIFSAASEYFHTYSITNIPKNDYNVEFKVSAYWITSDGTKVTGPERTLSVNIGIAATTEG